jgi:hypothetical protein
MPKNRDALKFFHNYLFEMIDIGGPNLPKSISTALGAKLGKILKTRGVPGFENNLKKIYKAINAKTKIKQINENTLDISLRHRSRFCPLGGKFNPDRAELIQETICIPYTAAILSFTHPGFKYSAEITDCILKSNNKVCRYILVKEPKNKNSSKE